MITIYHHTRCRKSREAIQFLTENKLDFEVVKYFENPLSISEMTKLLEMMEINPIELIRKNEPLWKTLYKHKALGEKELISIMCREPKLMERPIVRINNKAIIARPAEKILELL